MAHALAPDRAYYPCRAGGASSPRSWHRGVDGRSEGHLMWRRIAPGVALLALAGLLAVALLGRGPSPTLASLPPVYLTIVSHNEEPLGGRPDYTADRDFYLQNRSLLKLFAETITSRGATYNFESDWNYLQAVALYDVAPVTDNTAGNNIVHWMKEDLGV